jgi:hypothetical protein
MEHFGVKGMHWGTRKKSSGKSGSKETADSMGVSKSLAKIKSGGTKTLTNAELKAVVERMNLDQQYSRLSTSTKTLSEGRKFSTEVLREVGKDEAKKIVKEHIFKPLLKMVLKRNS